MSAAKGSAVERVAVPEGLFPGGGDRIRRVAGLARLSHARFAPFAARVPGPDDGAAGTAHLRSELKRETGKRTAEQAWLTDLGRVADEDQAFVPTRPAHRRGSPVV